MLKVRDFSEFKSIIEKVDKQRIRLESGLSQKTITFKNTFGGVVLVIKELPTNQLAITHMEFKNPRQGLGTIVLEELEKYARLHQMKSILVENASSKSMIAFCNKHNFKSIIGEVYITGDGLVYGNYELRLVEEVA